MTVLSQNFLRSSLGEGDVSVMSERAVGQNMSNVERDVLASPPPPPSPKVPPTPVFDPWEPLDPHVQLSTPKPIKVKKTLRIPPSLKKKVRDGNRTKLITAECELMPNHVLQPAYQLKC